MKTKRIIFVVTAAILVLAIVICGVIQSQFFSPGIHKIGSSYYFEYTAPCYLLSEGEVVGQSYMSIDGTIFDGVFRGYVSVDDYPVPMSIATGRISKEGAGFPLSPIASPRNERVVFIYRAFATQESFNSYYYQVEAPADHPENIIVFVMKGTEMICAAVAADSPEEAKTILARHEELWRK